MNKLYKNILQNLIKDQSNLSLETKLQSKIFKISIFYFLLAVFILPICIDITSYVLLRLNLLKTPISINIGIMVTHMIIMIGMIFLYYLYFNTKKEIENFAKLNEIKNKSTIFNVKEKEIFLSSHEKDLLAIQLRQLNVNFIAKVNAILMKSQEIKMQGSNVLLFIQILEKHEMIYHAEKVSETYMNPFQQYKLERV